MKICPKCGERRFMTGYSFENSAVTIDFVGNEFVFTPESDNQTREKRLCVCINCKEQFDLNDEGVRNAFIHQMKPCVRCGNKVAENEMDENGVCIVCQIKEKDPSFQGIEACTTDFNIIKMLAIVRSDNLKLSKENEQLKEQLQKASEITEKINNATTEEKPKRGRKKKTEDDQQQEEVQGEVINVDEDQNSTDDDIQISNEVAPDLPQEVVDMSNAMNPPEE